MMRILLLLALVPTIALAQPPGSGSAPAAGSAPVPPETPLPAGDPAPPPSTPDAAALRKTCTDAMNADPTFAAKIVEVADTNAAKKRLELDLAQHETAAKAVSKNQKHVILAYAAMWLVAVGFLLFLWRRQQLLKIEIAQLKTDLDAATKDGK